MNSNNFPSTCHINVLHIVDPGYTAEDITRYRLKCTGDFRETVEMPININDGEKKLHLDNCPPLNKHQLTEIKHDDDPFKIATTIYGSVEEGLRRPLTGKCHVAIKKYKLKN